MTNAREEREHTVRRADREEQRIWYGKKVKKARQRQRRAEVRAKELHAQRTGQGGRRR